MTYRFLLTIVLFLLCTSVVSASISISPLELTIAMDDQFISGTTGKTMTVYNNGNEEVNVTWYIEHPTPISYMRPNKTFLPNLSWITVAPQWSVLPPKGKGTFTLFSAIPDRPELYDQHWEVWVTFKSGTKGMFAFEHAVRVYIDTPLSVADGTLAGATDAFVVPISLIALVAGVLIGIAVVRHRWPHTRQGTHEKQTPPDSAATPPSTETRVDETVSSFEQRK